MACLAREPHRRRPGSSRFAVCGRMPQVRVAPMPVRTPVTADVRTPLAEDRAQVVDVLRTALNFSAAWANERSHALPLQDFRCVYAGDRVVATAAELRFHQWFGERPLATAGIYAVATLPEHRAAGLASAAVLRILDQARGRGDALTSLFPAVFGPDRKLGYELGGAVDPHKLPPGAIPPDRRGPPLGAGYAQGADPAAL